MRQKPKHQLFPAFRFLLQRAKTNQRKIRLRHLLLLLMRMALVALICLALASLRGRNQVGSHVLVIDATPSMDYTVADRSRLDDAKQRALELLNSIGTDSRVAVLDTGDLAQQWGSVEEARDKIGKMTMHPGGVPITSALSGAYRMLADQQDPAGDSSRATERHLYVFSDRTMSSWDSGRLPDLIGQRDRLGSPEVSNLFVDVGIDKPVDVAITQAEVKPAAVPENRDVVIQTTVTSIGQDCDTEIICKLAGENAAERKPIKIPAGGSAEVKFLNRKFKPGQYQAEISLATTDALRADNVRYVTFEVRGSRKILTITDDAEYARAWKLAFEVQGEFDCDVLTPNRIESIEQLRPYLAVCMLSVRNPTEKVADSTLWAKLREYVNQGGHLLVIPGRDEMNLEAYSGPDAMPLLPGKIEREVKTEQDKPAHWEPLNRKHPLLAKFASWKEQEDIGFLKYPRSAWRFWKVKDTASQNVIVRYDVEGRPPAMLERLNDVHRGQGRVLMLTTPLDIRQQESLEPWNDYFSTTVNDGFFVVLANELVAYMVGDMDESSYNFLSGQAVAIPLPPNARFPEYTLDAPGITGSDTKIARNQDASELTVKQTNFAGNARVSAGNPAWTASFSLNPPPGEFQLDRMPVDEIEKLFGPNSVVAPDRNQTLTAALGNRGQRTIDLFPWLTLAFVALLIAESIVANRFYKPDADVENLQPAATA